MRYKIIAIVSLLFMLSCSNNQSIELDENPPDNSILFTDQQIELSGIEIGKAQILSLSSGIDCKGKIMAKPQNRAKVSVPMNGHIKEIFIQEGQPVNKGDRLIVLEHPDYIRLQKEYLQAKSQFDYVEKEIERQRILSNNDAGVGKQLEKTEAEYEELQATLASLKLELDLINIDAAGLNPDNIRSLITIYAPITGNVNNLDVTLGEFSNPEDVMLEIINNNDFLIELQVFERDIHKIEVGQNVSYECSMPESKGNAHFAEIVYVGNFVDDVSKTFKVQASPNECSLGMRHGIYVDAKISVTSNRVQALPESSVFKDDDRTFVFTVHADTIFRRLFIETGIKENGFYEVLKPANFTETVVIKGGNYILAELEKE